MKNGKYTSHQERELRDRLMRVEPIELAKFLGQARLNAVKPRWYEKWLGLYEEPDDLRIAREVLYRRVQVARSKRW